MIFIVNKLDDKTLSGLKNVPNVVNFYEPYQEMFTSTLIDLEDTFVISKKTLFKWAIQKESFLLKTFFFQSSFSLWWLIDHRNFFFNFQEIVKAHFIYQQISTFSKGKLQTATILGEYPYLDFFLTQTENFQITFKKKVISYFVTFVIVTAIIGAVSLRKMLFLLFKKGKVKKSRIVVSYLASIWEGKKHNKLWKELIATLESQGESFTTTNYLNHTGANLKQLIQQTKYDKNFVPLEYSFRLFDIFNLYKKSLQLVNHVLKQEKSLKSIFVINQVNITPLVFPVLLKYVTRHLPFYFYFQNTFQHFLAKIQPKVFIQAPEAGFYGRIFNSVLKENNIKSIGLQHGNIYINHPTYAYLPSVFKENTSLPKHLACPRTDKTLVFSNNERDLLIEKCFYPVNTVEVVGNPFFDLYVHTTKHILVTELLQSLQLAAHRNTVVILLRTGGKYYTSIEDKQILEDIYTLLGQHDVNVIIKLHPLEKATLHEKVLQEMGTNKAHFLIRKDLNLGICLKAANLVIGLHSTALIDAALFEKKVIAYDPYQKKLLQEYVTKQVIDTANSKKELADKIKTLLAQNEKVAKQRMYQKIWKESMNFKTDGLSHQRIYEVINR